MAENIERGALTEAVYYILLSLYTPMHGYAVMQNISQLSNGRVALGAGTLYGAINTLVKKQWICAIASKNETRKKEYIITELGKEMVQEELKRLRELLHNGSNVTGDTNEKNC